MYTVRKYIEIKVFIYTLINTQMYINTYLNQFYLTTASSGSCICSKSSKTGLLICRYIDSWEIMQVFPHCKFQSRELLDGYHLK